MTLRERIGLAALFLQPTLLLILVFAMPFLALECSP